MIDDQHQKKKTPQCRTSEVALANWTIDFLGAFLTLKVNEEGNLLTSIDLGRT